MGSGMLSQGRRLRDPLPAPTLAIVWVNHLPLHPCRHRNERGGGGCRHICLHIGGAQQRVAGATRKGVTPPPPPQGGATYRVPANPLPRLCSSVQDLNRRMPCFASPFLQQQQRTRAHTHTHTHTCTHTHTHTGARTHTRTHAHAYRSEPNGSAAFMPHKGLPGK